MYVYITFGQIHVHSINGKIFDKDCLASIECEDYSEGRKKAREYFDLQWHQCLTKEELPGIIKYFPRGVISVE